MQNIYEAAYNVIAFLIAGTSLVYVFIWGKTDRGQNKLFLMLLVNTMVCAVATVTSAAVSPYCSTYPVASVIQDLSLYGYFILHSVVSPMLFFYTTHVTCSVYLHRKNRKHLILLCIPMFISETLVLLNPVTKWIYVIDSNYQFHRQWAEALVYLCAFFYFILAAAEIARYWKNLTKRINGAMVFMMGMSLFGVFIQMFFPSVRVELFGESLALLGLMLTVENEDDRIETTTGLNNRSAFLSDCVTKIGMKIPFSIITVKVSDTDSFQKLNGTLSKDALMRMISDFFCHIHPRYQIYRPSSSTFSLVLLDDSEMTAEELAQKIHLRFDEHWKYDDIELRLNAVVMYTSFPEEIKNLGEIIRMTDTPEPDDAFGYVMHGKDLIYLHRSVEVEQAIERGFTEHNFEVYYQPSYYLDSMDIHSAEALIRLHDNRLGDIPPAEFIPVAERSGRIDDIGHFVLEESCMFLSSGLPVEMGVEYISVNLSVMQCIQQGFSEYAREVVTKYDIPASLINFEIQESAAVSDFAILDKVIEELRSYGFRFSMDSYGTGFSDMQSIFALDLDTIKIDRVVLLKAQESPIGRIILDNCVRTIHEMHRKCLVEGVETQDQLDLLNTLDVDYVQGYFSSKPVTRNELLGILRFTELAHMEERRAIAASEAKSSFLANMSHEIRTPINAVLGMNEMILRECSPEEPQVKKYAEEIESAGRTLLSLINNILDYSKIEAGNMEIVEADYEVGSALKNLVRDAARQAANKHLDFQVHISENTPSVLYGDEFRLKQILTNLLNNAVKFTTTGGISLNVDSATSDYDDVLLIFTVEDSGCGIKEEDLGKLFQRFERLNTDKNLSMAGGGLGLAISYHLLQMMGGDIEAHSIYGCSSVFTVRILQKVKDATPIGDFKERYLNDMSDLSHRKSDFKAPEAHILVVDDTPLNLLVIKELLKKKELSIDTAESGFECLKKAKSRHYDLILLDERMPELSGKDTLSRLRSMDGPNRHTPVISLSANDQPGAKENVRKDGYNDFLTKPVDSMLLEDMLLNYLPEGKIFWR